MSFVFALISAAVPPFFLGSMRSYLSQQGRRCSCNEAVGIKAEDVNAESTTQHPWRLYPPGAHDSRVGQNEMELAQRSVTSYHFISQLESPMEWQCLLVAGEGTMDEKALKELEA